MTTKFKIITYFALIFSLGGLQAKSQTRNPDQKKPNIVFILVDDMGYGDIGAFFQKLRQQKNDRSEPFLFTPHLDQMVKEGAILTDHHAAAPVCAPSRASLLTGMSQGHANVRDNQFDKALEDNYTLGNVLKAEGYATVAIGKWGLQGKSKAQDWPAHPLKRGFDEYFGYLAHGDGHEHYPKEGLYRSPKKVWNNYEEISQDLDGCYTGDLFTARAKKYIIERKQQKPQHPFFMYLSYDTPHAVLELPSKAYPEHPGLKGGLQWLGKKGNMINTADGKPDSYIYPSYKNATYDHDRNPATAEVPWPETYQRFATVIQRIDDQVGDILQLLKDLEIDKQTLVVFSSDNGPSKESYLPKNYVSYEADFFNSFGPFDGIKRDLLEGGHRVPTIAWWPGRIKPETVVSSLGISYDWLPTFTEAAGAKAPVRSDGTSLLPALTGKEKQEERSIYIEYFNDAKTPAYAEFAPEHRQQKRGQMQMLRIGNLVGLRQEIVSEKDDFKIYDLSADRTQTLNLGGKQQLQQQFKDKVTQIRRPDPGAKRPYDSALVAASLVRPLKPRLKKQFFRAKESWIPKTEGLSAVAQNQANLEVSQGFIEIPEDGTYTFYFSSTRKGFVKIHEISLIDADYGYQPGQELKAEILLKAGFHPLSIYQKLEKSNDSFQLQWSFNGKAKSPVPASVFKAN